MTILDLVTLFARHPQIAALGRIVERQSPAVTLVDGLKGSAAPMAVAAMMHRFKPKRPVLCILNDEEEAGYFYHDLTAMLGDEQVLFYPSAYRRAAKYGSRDTANEILRTEVLGRLAQGDAIVVVTHPAPMAERIAPPDQYQATSLTLAEGETHNPDELARKLFDLGFQPKDYVYEPGEYALRGSLLDV